MDERLKARIAEAAPVIVAFQGLDYTIRWANAAYCDATGRNLEQIVGAKCWQAWGLSQKCRGCPVSTALETGQPTEAELTPLNQEHWPESRGSWLSRAAPVRDAEGEIVGATWAAFDITETVAARRRAEEQAHDLRATEQQLRASNQQLEAANQQLRAMEQQLLAANQALRANEQLLEQTGDMARVGGWEIDFHTNTVRWTRTTRAIHEVPDDYVPSLEQAIDFFPDARDELTAAVRRARQEGIPYDLELPFVTAKGRKLWVRTISHPELRDGRCVRLHGTVQDITERRQAQDRLAHERYLLEKSQELGHIGTRSLDLMANSLEWTDEACRIFGSPEGTVTNYEHFLSVVHPDDRDYVHREWTAAIAGKPYDIEHRILRDGETLHVREKADIERDDRGRAIRAIGFTQDITERKQAQEDMLAVNQQLRASNQQLAAANQQLRAMEQQLRASNQQLAAANQQLCASNSAMALSEQKYRTLVESSLQGVVIAQDGPVRLRFANAAMECISGYRVEELLAMEPPQLAGLVHPDDRARFFDSFQRRVAGEAVPTEAEYRILRKDGTTAWVLCYSSAIDYLGERATLTTFVDITDRKQADLRFRTAQEVSPDGFTILRPVRDGTGRVVDFVWLYQNAAVARLNGTDPDAVLGQRLLDLFPGHRGTRFFDAYRRVAETGEPVTFEDACSEEGMPRPIWLRIVVVPMDGDIAVLAQDISERVEAAQQVRASNQQLAAANQQLRATEQQLRQNERRSRALIDHSPVCHKVVDLDFNLQYMSANGFHMLKLPQTDERYGEPYPFDFFPEAAQEALRGALSRVKASGKIVTFESEACDVEGSAVWLHHSIIPVFNERGAIDYITVVSADITERKQGEQTLRRFQWLNDKEQLEADPAAEAYAYAPPYGDVAALNSCRVIADAVGQGALADMGRDLMDLLDTSVAVYEQSGDYAFGVFESAWCRLLDRASFALCATDDTREALRCGAWLCHENCWRDSAEAAMRSGAPVDIECVGGIRLYAVPILAAGEVVGAINVGYGTPPRDEETLRALAQRFGRPLDELRRAAQAYKPRPQFIVDVAKRRCRNIARTIGDAVQKARLEAQLAQADRLSSMGTLAAGVAHEINNPLAYTLYNLETVVADLPDVFADYRKMMLASGATPRTDGASGGFARGAGELEDLLDRAREALDGAQRIRAIARTLGTFARVEDTQDAPVDIRRAVEHARNMARNETKYRARLLLDLSPTPPVLGSEGKLAQVFLNLLVNAAHAIDEGDVEGNTVRIRTGVDGDAVVAEVSDTGKGIPREHLQRLFDPFFTTKPVGQGSGLGLSISKKIIADMGGDITCESQEGRGTTFRIRLPALRGAETGWQEGARSAEPSVSRAGGRVLVVDDEAGIRAAISRMLGRDNHEVVTAASGAEARELLLQDQRFDLIILDLMMPQVSGMDLHRWLAQTHPELARRVIFVTGGVFTPAARTYLAEVDNLRLEKPLDAASFRKLVAQRVAGRAGGDGGMRPRVGRGCRRPGCRPVSAARLPAGGAVGDRWPGGGRSNPKARAHAAGQSHATAWSSRGPCPRGRSSKRAFVVPGSRPAGSARAVASRGAGRSPAAGPRAGRARRDRGQRGRGLEAGARAAASRRRLARSCRGRRSRPA